MNKLFPAAIIAIGIVVSTASSAQAASKCQDASFSFTACKGSYQLGKGENDVQDGSSDNLVTQKLNDENVFGDRDWMFGAKYDANTSGSNHEGFSVSGLGKTSGNFSFSNLDWNKTEVAISLKSSKGYSLYHLTADDLDENGTLAWDTLGTSTNKQKKAQGLSHISYYTRISPITLEVAERLKRVSEPTVMSDLLAVGLIAALRKQGLKR